MRCVGGGARTASIVLRSRSCAIRVMKATHHVDTEPAYAWLIGLATT